MLVKINPCGIPGRWRLGISLDVHTISSDFLGHDEYGHPVFDTKRSEIGELLYRLKYSSDFGAVNDIAETAASYVGRLQQAPYSFTPTLIVPVPPSRQRPRQPLYELATAIGQLLGVAVATDAVWRTKPLVELKEVLDYTQRLELLRGAHAVSTAKTAGKSVLLFDDLFRSGASMTAIANVLVDAGGVIDLCALTITRTRSNR